MWRTKLNCFLAFFDVCVWLNLLLLLLLMSDWCLWERRKILFCNVFIRILKLKIFQTVSEIHDILSNIIKKIKENSEYVMNSKQLFFAYFDTILSTFATYSAHHLPLLEFLIHIFHNISNFPHIHYSVMWKYLCEFFSRYRARETLVYVLSHYCLQLTI